MKKIILCLLLALVFLTGCTESKEVLKKSSIPKFSVTEDSTEVTIYFDVKNIIATIKPESIRGMNLNNSMQVAKVVDKALALKIPTITYPAGNMGDSQDCNREIDFSLFSLQQSMVNNPFTFVQTRVFGGSVEGAVQSVKNAEKVGIRVDVWSIGNEPDLYHKAHAPEWTPEYYNKVFREQVMAMRAYKPDIKVAGPMVSQPKDDWILSFIKENGDIVDVLAWHWYPTSGDASDELALATAPDIVNQIRRYRKWLKDPATNPKGYKRDIKLALTEYAIHWNTPNKRHLADMVGAMWLAEVLGYLAREGIDYSHYFCFGEYGGHSLFEPGNFAPRPSYWVFNFYANYIATNMIDVASSDSKVKVFGFKDNDVYYFIIVNQSQKNIKKLTLTPLNLEKKLSKLEGKILTGELKGPKITEIGSNIDANVLLEVPPYSVAALKVE
jgi:hypothetical protein